MKELFNRKHLAQKQTIWYAKCKVGCISVPIEKFLNSIFYRRSFGIENSMQHTLAYVIAVFKSIYHPVFHSSLNFLADLFYSGEAVQFDQPQSFTCPFCGKLGLKEIQLHEHVTREHLTSSAEVVSICYKERTIVLYAKSGTFFLPLSE